MKKAALYLVGIHDDKRLHRLRQFADEKGYKIGEEEYMDEAPDDRKEFTRLLLKAGDEGVRAVVVNGLGQFGPTPGLQLEALLKIFEASMGIVSFAEDLDSSTTEGREILLRMIKDIEEKLNPLPQPRPPGSRNRPGRKAAVFDVEKGVRQRIEEGRSFTEIGTDLGVSKTTAHNRITRALLKRLELFLVGQEPI